MDTLQIASKEGRSQNYVPPLQGYYLQQHLKSVVVSFFSFCFIEIVQFLMFTEMNKMEIFSFYC